MAAHSSHWQSLSPDTPGDISPMAASHGIYPSLIQSLWQCGQWRRVMKWWQAKSVIILSFEQTGWRPPEIHRLEMGERCLLAFSYHCLWALAKWTVNSILCLPSVINLGICAQCVTPAWCALLPSSSHFCMCVLDPSEVSCQSIRTHW